MGDAAPHAVEALIERISQLGVVHSTLSATAIAVDQAPVLGVLARELAAVVDALAAVDSLEGFASSSFVLSAITFPEE